MCGLCGELRFDGDHPKLEVITAMMEVMERRGPDHGSTFLDVPLAFGHRRLAIIDRTEASDQPMHDSELSLSLVFNGTIYNFKELRNDLIKLGYKFRSEGDTEVILKAYHAFGTECVTKLNGMFAFAIWDQKSKTLFIARDRTGIKPLYYTINSKLFRFASSLQALLTTDISKEIDKEAVYHHFTLHCVVPAPRTILKNVKKLPPATWQLIAADGSIKTKQYWNLDNTKTCSLTSYDEWIEKIQNQLEASIIRQYKTSDVPVGVFLSGGIDSGLLVALLAKHGVQDLSTFTIGFEDDVNEEGSEFYYADIVAKKFRTKHHELLITNAELLSRLPEVIKMMAEPMVSQDVASFYLLSEFVTSRNKVVLCGQGADELFGGYFWYPLMQSEKGSNLDRFAKHYFDRHHTEMLEMISPDFSVDDVTSPLVQQFLDKNTTTSFIDSVLRFDISTLVVDDPVKRIDNMTMSHGLEARVPYLDHDLIELATRMPANLKLRNKGKWPLKMISRNLLPEEIITRSKCYFPSPALKYLRGSFLNFVTDTLNSGRCRNRGLYQRSYVEKLLSNPNEYFTAIQGNKLWHLALLELWFQLNVD